MKAQLLTTTGIAAMMLLAQASGAQAGKTIVGTIYGSYDAQCGVNIDCSFGTGYTVAGNGTDYYDTPNLFIVNSSATNSLANLTFSFTGYQGLNNTLTGSFGPITVGTQTVYQVNWNDNATNVGAEGDLFGYDYDDSYGFTHTNSACNAVGQSLCAQVGNFNVKITGTLNGNPIASTFGPEAALNQQGIFVGWEGLDPNGYSESTYDAHTGSTPGVLAYIYTGTTGTNHPAPEPATLSLLGAGLGALGLARRRRKK